MSRGQRTRDHIIREAARLFNQRGYFGTSVSDIQAASGLQKGGIYNHFETKEEIALQSFEYINAQITVRLRAAVDPAGSAVDNLRMIVLAFRSLTLEPPVEGGCPIMNVAIESDDAHPELRNWAHDSMV